MGNGGTKPDAGAGGGVNAAKAVLSHLLALVSAEAGVNLLHSGPCQEDSRSARDEFNDEGAPRTSTRRERRPAWRGQRHDFPISCSHNEPFIHAPILAPQSARRSAKGNYVPSGMQDGHRLCPDLPETFEA